MDGFFNGLIVNRLPILGSVLSYYPLHRIKEYRIKTSGNYFGMDSKQLL